MLNFKTYTRRYVVPLWPWYASGMVLLALVNAINLYIPQFAKEIINRLTSTTPKLVPEISEASTSIAGASNMAPLKDPTMVTSHPSWAHLGVKEIALVIVGLGLMLVITRTFSRILIFWPGRKIETDTKYDLFTKILRLPEDFFTKVGLGDLISRLANDTGQLRAFFAFGMLQILNVLFLCVMTLWMMFKTNAILTLLTIAPLFLMLLITRFAMPKMQESSREQQKAIGELTNHVTESFVNVHVIQTNAASEAFLSKIERSNEQVYQTNIKILWIRTLIFPLMSCLAGLSQLAVLIYGGFLVSQKKLTVGDILAFNVYIGLLTFPLTALGIILAVYQRAKTALERLETIDNAQVEKPIITVSETNEAHLRPNDPVSPVPILSVKNLSFAYNGREECLKNIHLDLTENKIIGLFGRVGSGKSTLLHLLARLETPPKNSIFFEGQDILSLEPEILRKQVGLTIQGVHLFSDTVRENLSFGIDPPPSMDALSEAARLSCILDEVNSFAQGWDTQIGEKGIRLSGGQKQRLSLARMLLRRPKVLILDDILSAVDHVTEQTILNHLISLKSPILIASHRPSTLKRCHEVIILNQGKVEARGSYSQVEAYFEEFTRAT